MLMPRPSRSRRIAKWSGVVVCVGMVVGSIVSRRAGVGYTFSRADGSKLQMNAIFGAIVLVNYPAAGTMQYSRSGLEYGSQEKQRFQWLPWAKLGGGKTVIVCPMWMILIAVAPPTAYLFWRDRRYPPGHCQKCGYDLQGNISGVCPECGRVT